MGDGNCREETRATSYSGENKYTCRRTHWKVSGAGLWIDNLIKYISHKPHNLYNAEQLSWWAIIVSCEKCYPVTYSVFLSLCVITSKVTSCCILWNYFRYSIDISVSSTTVKKSQIIILFNPWNQGTFSLSK